MTGTVQTAYLAPDGFERELGHELGADALAVGERLLVAPGPPRAAAWAQNVWLSPAQLRFESIGDAAKQLKAIQRNWVLFSTHHHRRARLIEERLPVVRRREWPFPSELPTAPLGSFTLLDEHTMLAAPRCSSPYPNGELPFIEDTEGPPSRAYLKLWEALTLLGRHPKPGERCIDAGSSPGGWTWVLAKLGASVHSVDKAELAPRVAAMPGVRFERGSAFALDPRTAGPIDWFCSDVICYPERLLALVRRFLDAGTCRNFVCTLKFQGDTDHATTRAFAAIPGGRVLHLFHNRHELTFVWPAPPALPA